eukprot:8313796-Alexandrium_andersonii.AAC.1
MFYLGTWKKDNTDLRAEASYRVGQAEQALLKSDIAWKYRGLTLTAKLQIHSACVKTRLLYSLG